MRTDFTTLAKTYQKSSSSKEEAELEAESEMGGMIITGFDRGNPINVLVRGQLCLPYHALKAETTIYDSEGKPVDAERDQLIEKLYNDCLDRVSEHKYKTVPVKLIQGNRDLLDQGKDNPQSTSQHEYRGCRGRFFQWFNVTNTTGMPCLIALMAGDAGFDTETSSNEDLIREATETLRSVFGPDVPHPLEAVVTRWGSDPFARGSYSSAAPDMQPKDYDNMAKPLGNLFFAGEHTIGTHPATVHGAYLSGLRAASEVAEAIFGPIEVPTPLILPRDSLLLQKRKEAAKDPRQARKDAYETEAWDHVQSMLGERPVPPAKVAGNAYMLFSKMYFDEARRRCEEKLKAGRTKAMPNDVRVMTSRMWKEASEETRRPFEAQAAEQKQAYAEAMAQYTQSAEKWDLTAIDIRADYERTHPFTPEPGDPATGFEGGRVLTPKSRRRLNVSYAEDADSKMEF
ncbi:lysine-specific histone demethylase 1 [Cordyceps fumosorosea ARSEF 2679]|uniref:Lysine-specific histone demethylase 1 n=1 Tax=Cordyceps fumosorosea (strain ARSEF 2679) TaxID=1081104 RepID=A0A167ZH91_CORFA|nr:lysine-specific histone demethylase 1 [Cordyceps fumosorosea ARSEF 2679]OAA67514.1 lysine-specific histone demethylase 1 [Cordyceps fumosorosea ARSEF 2679]